LAVFGLTTPAEAQKPNTFKLTLCHRTNAPTNPYRMITVSVDASNGAIVGPDHTGHPGPVFDFSADPADPDYPYTTPRSGDQWGDIIPPYSYDGGSFPGMNWEDGAAIHEAGCQGPEEQPDPTCPEGQTWVDDEDGVLEEGECQTPVEPEAVLAATIACATPAGMKVTVTNTGEVSGLVDITSNDAVVHNDVVVPAGGSVELVVDVAEDAAYDIDVVDVQAFTGTRDCVEVEAVVVTTTSTTAPPSAPTQVAGVQVTRAAELPRTGKSTLPLAELGFGLVLLGAGALVYTRGQATTA
jgi:hypothetical protein